MKKIMIMIAAVASLCYLGLSLTGCRHVITDDQSDSDSVATLKVDTVSSPADSSVTDDDVPVSGNTGVDAAQSPKPSSPADPEDVDSQLVQNFKKKYDNLAILNVIVPRNISPVREAFNKLPKAEQKSEYDTKISAYEEMAKANGYKAIQDVLQKYPDKFSKKQKAALQKVNSEIGYERTIRKKGQINIDFINKELQ